mgnify:CR=1 FL=1
MPDGAEVAGLAAATLACVYFPKQSSAVGVLTVLVKGP